MFVLSLLTVLCAVLGVLAASGWIAPGAVWLDSDGNKIDAHGGGVVKRGDTFFWVGHSASSRFGIFTLISRKPNPKGSSF